ncbi:Aerolysin toxin-domain-containing protein [Hypoxylon sp. NC0597]|nr:Aerolysin toxin-domain-containing protein [Hypoxylon sp. NC0597]
MAAESFMILPTVEPMIGANRGVSRKPRRLLAAFSLKDKAGSFGLLSTIRLSTKAVTESAKNDSSVEIDKSLRWLEIEDSSNGNQDEDDDNETHYVLQYREQANNFVHTIGEPLNLISIVGPTRGGKSTLMNLLAGCETKPLFNTASGSESCTKGIDLGNKVMTLEDFSTTNGCEKVVPEASDQKIAFIDTEGQGDAGDKYDVILFTPAILCSRIIIFNTTTVAKDTVLNNLHMMTLAADKLDFGNETGSGAKFGELIIMVNKYDLGDTAEEIQKHLLDKEEGTSKAVKNRNKIRDNIAKQFQAVSVYVLRGNALKDGVQEKINDGTIDFLKLDHFKESYVKDFKALRTKLSKTLKSPRVVAGQAISGTSTSNFMPSIVKAINKLEEDGTLHVPDIWEDAENEAVQKASIQFRSDFTKKCDELNQNAKPIATEKCKSTLDEAIQDCLNTVRKDLRYLQPKKVNDTCSSLCREVETQKEGVLSTNLHKIETFAKLELKKLIDSLPTTLSDALKNNSLPSVDVVTATLKQLNGELITTYKEMISNYDSRALPEGYSETYNGAFTTASTSARQTISSAWKSWVVETDNNHIELLRTSLQSLNDTTAVGNDSQWERDAQKALDVNIEKYNDVIAVDYLWESPQEVEETYKKKAESAKDIAKSQFEGNEEGVKGKIEAERKNQLAAYQRQLDDALSPKEDPGSYQDITNASTFRNNFIKYMKTQKISESLSKDYLDKFDNDVSAKKSQFRQSYNDAYETFKQYLQTELDSIVLNRLGDFKFAADQKTISEKLLKSQLSSYLDLKEQSAMADFETDIEPFKITQSDSKTKVKASRLKLQYDIADHKASKFELLETLVAAYNRELLNNCVNPVRRDVIDCKIGSVSCLDSRIEEAKSSFFGSACGDKDEQQATWQGFASETSKLLENVRLFQLTSNGNTVNLLTIDFDRRAQKMSFIKDVSGRSITTEMEKEVISKVKGNIANLANVLGMSWINSPTPFSHSISQQGKARSHLLRNEGQPSGYDSDHRTSLRFDSWKVEFSDFIFDDPIVQEMKPVVAYTMTSPRQKEDTTSTVSIRRTESETISNTNEVMFQADTEYSSSAGIEGVASASVKVAFQAGARFSNTKENQVSFEVNYENPVVCPANRQTTINLLVFKQQTSVTYTAKMKIVPQVTFTGGFTRWGGENNEHPNFLRGHSRQRIYEDIHNGYADEFKAKAAANADPWDWRGCMEKYGGVQGLVNRISDNWNYETYVRGKWEGISGWKYVLQTDIKV